MDVLNHTGELRGIFGDPLDCLGVKKQGAAVWRTEKKTCVLGMVGGDGRGAAEPVRGRGSTSERKFCHCLKGGRKGMLGAWLSSTEG
ncbi:hypothetical protein GOP47_0025662 [Adiantum capillus-veneris]|uniref:Uncharacterized protein n=1 Tax=Adiantum capillus-veneris TaxID=13818 RepID=A0A9D4U1N9_ADICA|nr:hypothetical protein GOP47_0025662 [Adiantum capillus-veneris]